MFAPFEDKELVLAGRAQGVCDAINKNYLELLKTLIEPKNRFHALGVEFSSGSGIGVQTPIGKMTSRLEYVPFERTIAGRLLFERAIGSGPSPKVKPVFSLIIFHDGGYQNGDTGDQRWMLDGFADEQNLNRLARSLIAAQLRSASDPA